MTAKSTDRTCWFVDEPCASCGARMATDGATLWCSARCAEAKPPVIAVVGDTHFGSSVGLAPAEFRLADGGCYRASPLQQQLWKFWNEYWRFVDEVRDGAPYILVHGGDLVDGVHHRSAQHVDANLAFQQRMAEDVLGPKARAAKAYYQIAGTSAHVGEGASLEESVARALGAVPDSQGRYARQHLYARFGAERISFAHHIGTTTSAAYKSSPLMRLMAASYADAGESGTQPPTLWVRSHCLSEDSELLTKEGWKGPRQLKERDEVLQWDSTTNLCSWALPSRYVKDDTAQEMISITGRGLDMLVTPKHDVVTRRTGFWASRGEWVKVKAETLVGKTIFIPVAGNYEAKGCACSLEELRLLGMIMADGGLVKGYGKYRRPYAIRIGQRASNWHVVSSLLSAAGVKYTEQKCFTKAGMSREDTRNGKRIVSKEDARLAYIGAKEAARFINCLEPDKSLRPWLMEMTTAQFDALLEGLMLGDGSAEGGKLFNNNLNMMDQLQSLMVRHGYKSKLTKRATYLQKRTGLLVSSYVLNFTKRSEIQVNFDGKHIQRVAYPGGSTWCVTVPAGNVVVRRNGSVFITGNCHDYTEVRRSKGTVITCPAWQGKSDWLWSKDTVSHPPFGGLVIKQGEGGRAWVRTFLRHLEREEPITL